MSDRIFLSLIIISAIIWIYLLGFRGQFWRSNQRFKPQTIELESYPSVTAIIPARNEAELLPIALRSVLNQDYPGSFSVILVDDRSTDGTANLAKEVAEKSSKPQQLKVIESQPLPPGWTGKLWAIEQGISQAQKITPLPDYFWLTDADIEHDLTNLRQLVIKAQRDNLNLVSLMVLLKCQTFWEKLLIPAFVFFFQKLYPFAWVNDPNNPTAAAAGGCIVIQRQALECIGGIQAVRQALIDDCTLAQAVKSSSQSDRTKSIWLGLTTTTHSLRTYSSLSRIWDTIARTAFTQLNYSAWLLLATLLGMVLTYLVSPIGLVISILTRDWITAITSLFTWSLMTVAYLPTIRLYKISSLWAFYLPAIAFLYILMTIDSAVRYWRGQGGAWKGRVYPQV
ncbi:hopene-associated glycosyltransferase HpnB [Pleurocapsa sp. PCC 7327]|uniref:glycosyltransferase n=1 Tax=Pleurocapsa sp. PCC 7327 TaxID=118163 RepID=UPI00029FD7A6|nr:glycosyltransferase [Pleurocapsa sp. PCC 7327]AFY77993.1 hopene-associated glycosyltransferase HpnB [Pleurocapsa sp. PCC 7327]